MVTFYLLMKNKSQHASKVYFRSKSIVHIRKCPNIFLRTDRLHEKNHMITSADKKLHH